MSHQNASVKSILFALLANLGISIIAKMKKENPAIQWVFFEPDTKE